MKNLKPDHIRKFVREKYGSIADASGCGCGTSASGCCVPETGTVDKAGQQIGYSKPELDSAVEGSNMGLGCGNPTAFAQLKVGETVLDLGSGGGFDCFLAAKAVGDEGRVIGVDMTAEMVSKARENAEKSGANNVEFRLGEIEHLPVADASVDVILSNCVINLSPEKAQVFREAFRVLKPGGRLKVSDIVAIAQMPPEMREQAALLTGCIAGAERTDILESMLHEIGFSDVDIRIRRQRFDWVREMFPGSEAEKYVASADIEAVKS